MAARQYVNDVQGSVFGDARVSAIVSQTLLEARHQERGGGCFIGSVCARISKLWERVEERSGEEGEKSVGEHSATWDEWSLVIGSKLVGKTDEGGQERTCLVAHVEVQRAGPSGEEEEDGWVCSLKCDRAVVLKVHWYVGGCACELGCAKSDGDGGCMEKETEVWSEWGRIRGGGVDIEIMGVEELSQWAKRHSGECSLHVSARVDLVGVQAGESDTVCSGSEDEEDGDRADGSDCDSSGGGDDEDKEEEFGCGCRKCIEEGCSIGQDAN